MVHLFSSLRFLSRFYCFFVVHFFSSLGFLCSYFFVVHFFSSLGFLSGWLSGFLVVNFFSSLRFLCSRFLVVNFLSSLRFLRCIFLHCFFVVFLSSLGFLCSFMVFLVRSFVNGFSRCSSGSRGGCCGWRSSSWRSCGVSSESNRRHTHSSGDNQCK